jgi:hypothetical protein
VDLEEGTCECMQFYEYQTVCKHALIAIQHAREDPYEYVFGTYKTDTRQIHTEIHIKSS